MFTHPLLSRARRLLDERVLDEQVLNRTAGVVTALLVAVLGYSLAQATWVILAPGPSVVGGAAQALRSPAGAAGADAESYARRIASLHLFGEANQGPGPAQSIQAPETHLNLTLRGVAANDDPALARAIIASPKAGEESYAIGDDIPGGAKLRKILPDRVLLERKGRYETLRLPKEGLSDVTRTESAPATGPSGSGSPPTPLSQLPPDAPLSEYRDALVANPEELAQVGRAVAIRHDGRFAGFRIIPGRNRELLKRIGIRPGDIVTAVNGIRLDNPLKGLEVLRNLSGATEVTVTVLRNGQPQTFSVPMD